MCSDLSMQRAKQKGTCFISVVTVVITAAVEKDEVSLIGTNQNSTKLKTKLFTQITIHYHHQQQQK